MTVTQFHYTAWPDHGVPDNFMSVIRFIRHVRKLFPSSQDTPLLVHCSAGVGHHSGYDDATDEGSVSASVLEI